MKRKGARERLLDTATQLFYDQGYNRTGINEILEKSGVAKASMYQHFRSKEDILMEYLKIMEARGNSNLKNSLEERPDGKETVLGIFDFVLDFFHQPQFRGCWSQNVISEVGNENEKIANEVRAQKNRFRRIVQSVVRDNLNVRDPEQLGTRIYLLYEAALADSQIFRQDWPIREARDMADTLIDISAE